MLSLLGMLPWRLMAIGAALLVVFGLIWRLEQRASYAERQAFDAQAHSVAAEARAQAAEEAVAAVRQASRTAASARSNRAPVRQSLEIDHASLPLSANSRSRLRQLRDVGSRSSGSSNPASP